MLTQEQKARLTPEELIIAKKWDKEKEDRDVIFEEIKLAISTNSLDTVMAISEKMGDGIPDQ